MASVTGKTSIKIDDLINNTIVSGYVDPGSGNLILVTRGGATLNAGAIVKPFGAPWSSISSYANGDVVGYAGSLWKALGSSTNKPPALFTSLWTRLTGESLSTWVERDSYFSGDALSESWNLFWKTGTITSSLTKITGEYETGIQALKLDMGASSFQRFYQFEENILFGGEVVTVAIRARLLNTAPGVTINAELLQNDASGKPDPFETNVSYASSAEGAINLTTSWATYVFTMAAVNGRPRSVVDILINTSSSSAVVLIDRVKISKGTEGGFRKPDIQIFTANGTWTKPKGAVLVEIECIGGGGGGGGAGAAASGAHAKGGGGAAGNRSFTQIRADLLGASESVVVGAAGVGVTAAGGTAGGTSSFGSVAVAPGGGGGVSGGSSTASWATPGGDGRGSGGVGDLVTPGESGGYGFGGGALGVGGYGAPGKYGHGGRGGQSGSAGQSITGGAAAGYGAGGGGALSTSTAAASAGGVGTSGIVIVKTYFQ